MSNVCRVTRPPMLSGKLSSAVQLSRNSCRKLQREPVLSGRFVKAKQLHKIRHCSCCKLEKLPAGNIAKAAQSLRSSEVKLLKAPKVSGKLQS